MGTIITTPIRTAKLTIQLNDPDDNDVITKVELFQDGEQLEVFEPNQKDVLLEKTYTPSEGKHYIWAKVTQADGNLLWGAPIWFIASGKAE